MVAGNSQKPSRRPPGATETTPKKRGGFPRLPATLKSRLDAPRGRRNDSGEARRVSAVDGNSQKPSRRPLGPPKRLRRSEEDFRGSRHLSKAVSTSPGEAETAPEKREGSGEARRLSAEAGNSQKPPKRLRRSAKTIRGSRHLSKAASFPASSWLTTTLTGISKRSTR